jgi:hypothetical protein
LNLQPTTYNYGERYIQLNGGDVAGESSSEIRWALFVERPQISPLLQNRDIAAVGLATSCGWKYGTVWFPRKNILSRDTPHLLLSKVTALKRAAEISRSKPSATELKPSSNRAAATTRVRNPGFREQRLEPWVDRQLYRPLGTRQSASLSPRILLELLRRFYEAAGR